MPLETLLPFFAAALLLGLAPGPDNLFVLAQSVWQGARAGLLVTLGLCTGLLVHSAAVAFGVAVVFRTSAAAFMALKIAGAGYLAYLAWRAFRAPVPGGADAAETAAGQGRLYLRGIIMNVTNPKVLLFFVAFLPQFADPRRGPVWIQILLLGGVFILATVLVFGSIALGAGALGRWLARSPRAGAVLNKAAGVIFLALAVLLALATRA